MQVLRSKGRIVRLTVRKSDMFLTDCEVLLDIETHLSFPNFLKVGPDVFIYPENGASGTLSCYKYGNTLEKCGVVLNQPVYDSTICLADGVYYLLCTEKTNPNGNILSVYGSSNPFSGYEKIQEIVFSDSIARRAGNVFHWNGNLISPAQICNKYYGEGLSFQQIAVKGGKLAFREIKRMYPKGGMLSPGLHTWNFLPVSKNMIVIDGYKFGSKLFHDFYFKIRGFKEM